MREYVREEKLLSDPEQVIRIGVYFEFDLKGSGEAGRMNFASFYFKFYFDR